LLNQIISDGQRKNEIKTDMLAQDIVKVYALCERALLYDWCISKGAYSLSEYSSNLMPMFLKEFRVQ